MSLALHLPSVLLIAAVVGLLGAALMSRDGMPDQEADRGGVWLPLLMAALFQPIASLGHALRGELPPMLVFSAVNAVQLFALALLWLGARRLAGRDWPLWMATLAPGIWLAACLIPGFLESMAQRISLFAPISLGLMGWSIRDLLHLRARDGLRAALDLAIFLGLVALGLAGLFTETIRAPRPLADGWGIMGTTAVIIIAIYGSTLPFLILNIRRERERAMLDARQFAVAAAGRAEAERLHEGLPAVILLHEMQPDGSFRLRYRGGDLEGVSGWPPERLAAADGPLATPNSEGWSLHGHLRAALREGMVREDWRLRQPDGSHRTIRSETRVLGPAPDGAIELVGYALDVTQERLAEARSIAAMRLASVADMGTGLAHEVKQPLQALSLAAELAQVALGPYAPPQARRKIEIVLREAERAADIIEHVRRFAHGAPADATPVPLSLAGPVDGALRLVRVALAEAGAEVELDLGDPPLMALGVAATLEQVLVSLLLNARDALADQPPGRPRRVSIIAAPLAEGRAVLSVADTGGGIAPDILPRLFEPFVTTKGPDRGRGLALAAAHGSVRSMGGVLSGANGDQGAAFTVTLPSPPASTLVSAERMIGTPGRLAEA